MTKINLDLRSRVEGQWAVVDATGEIDLHTAPRLREEMDGLLGAGHRRLLLNLDSVEFMDSTGLGVLVGSLKRLREQEGTIELAGPKHGVRRVLDVTGLTKIFRIHPSVADAVAEG